MSDDAGVHALVRAPGHQHVHGAGVDAKAGELLLWQGARGGDTVDPGAEGGRGDRPGNGAIAEPEVECCYVAKNKGHTRSVRRLAVRLRENFRKSGPVKQNAVLATVVVEKEPQLSG